MTPFQSVNILFGIPMTQRLSLIFFFYAPERIIFNNLNLVAIMNSIGRNALPLPINVAINDD